MQKEIAMPGIRFVMSTLIALTVAAVSTTTAARAADVDASLRSELDRVAQRRIFFGHQSVGNNLLDGVKQLAAMVGAPVNVVEVKAASAVGSAMIGHALIPENGEPLKKLKSFEQAMSSKSASLDIAFMKFCYVDFTAETNATALFESYRSTLDALQAKNPGTTFVHVTAPLIVVQGGIKAGVKRLLGNAPYGTLENMRREEYNTLLRQAYQGRAPIFDLAKVESTSPDGTVETVEWKGRAAPAMAPVYSDDGGHLNAVGKLRAARELVSILASIQGRTAASRP